MTCSQFDDLVADLARTRAGVDGSGPVGPWVQDAEGHVASCQRCATRLADEEALSAVMRAVSRSSRQASAPEHVEAAILEVFRRSCELRPVPAASQSRVAGAARTPAWEAWAGLAAAAVLVLAAGVAWNRWADGAATSSGTAAVVPASPAGLEENGSVPGVSTFTESDSPVVAAEPERASTGGAPSRSARPRPDGAQVTEAADAAASHFHWVSWTNSARGDGQVSVPSTEIDTAPMVRVRVARAALVALGLLDAGTGDPAAVLEADVIVGEDGLARAIRIVSPEGVAPRPESPGSKGSALDSIPLEGEL